MNYLTRLLLSASIVCLCEVACSNSSDVNGAAPGSSAVQRASPGRLPGHTPSLDRVNLAPSLKMSQRVEMRRSSATIARLPESANTAAITATSCPPNALQWGVPVTCGYVAVPLDWSHPHSLGQISVYFELYVPERSGPAQSAMMFNYGGPGGATIEGGRGTAFFLFSQNLDAHDFLMIDDRGRGLSSTIYCPDLQNGTAPFAQAEAECAAQLGQTASRYGTGEIAQDTDAVRAALGYDKVDYFGWSYGGADVEAYATRFGQHLRSIVVDSPFGTPAVDTLAFDKARTKGDNQLVRLDCQRSPLCAADHPLPDIELALLVEAVRLHPVEGNTFDAYGNPTHIRIDEAGLLNWIIDNPTGNMTNTGEILAAGSALFRGDPLPLLRLGGEQNFGLGGNNGDPTFFSKGAELATACVDQQQHWDWAAPVVARQRQFEAAVDALPRFYFAPYSKDVVTAPLYDLLGSACTWWEKPTLSSPIEPANAKFPNVPTLVLSGDLDERVPLELTIAYAELFSNSTFVKVPEATHVSVLWSTCAQNLVTEFIENLSADTHCAATPDVVWPAVGRFPLVAKDARAAKVDPAGNNTADERERRVATVAVATATDAMQRWSLNLFTGGPGSGVGLRGGTFATTNFDGTAWTVTLTNAALTQDVTVTGNVTWSPSSPALLGWPGDASFVADLTVAGPGTKGGQVHVQGTWQARGPVGNFSVTGTLGGQTVAVLVPEA